MADWRSDVTDPNASALADLVARVIRSGAVSEVRTARVVTDGLQHSVVILDEDLVARFPRDEHAAESLRTPNAQRHPMPERDASCRGG